MIDVIFKALTIGLVLAIIPGAAFFSIIHTSLSKGFRRAFFLAMGIATSDIFLIACCYLGVAKLLDDPLNNVLMGAIGGIILIIYGVFTFLKKEIDSKSKIEEITPRIEQKIITSNKNTLYFFKGFLFNITNPFVWILWLGITTSSSGYSHRQMLIFLIMILATVFSADCLKGYFASKIKKIMSQKILLIVNRIAGISLGVCGMVLIIRTIIELYFK